MSDRETEYRKAVRRMFTIIGQGTGASWLAIRVGFRELARLDAELGADRARTLHREEARAWHRRTGLDPWSGVRTATYQDFAA